MTTVASQVQVAVTGGISTAAVGTALPTSPTATPDVLFKDVGYISEDGVTQATGDSTTEIKAWQNGDVVRRIQTDHSVTFSFMMIETNAVSLDAYYGGNYSAGVVQMKAGVMPRRSWILDMLDGTSKIRNVIPDGQITDRGDVVWKNGDKVGYQVTIECYPDASGVKAYQYLATGAVSA